MSQTSTSTTKSNEVVKYNIDVLNLTQSSQIQFGLRLQDYSKYRHYCTKRISKLRKQIRTLYGKKSYISKIVEAKQINDHRYLLIMLFKSERAWAYAMDLKKEFEQGTNTRAGFHMSRRFAKAALHSTEFEKYCQELADPLTIIESQAYASWHRSSVLINREENWSKALEEITVSRTIYEGLSNLGDQSQKDLYLKRIEESDQIIRFCKYNLRGLDKTASKDQSSTTEINSKLIESIKLNLQELNKNTKISTEKDQSSFITWKSKNIKVENDKLKERIEAFENYKKQNESKLPKSISQVNPNESHQSNQIYDKLVGNLINCEVILKNEIEHYSRINAKNKTVKSETEESNLRVLLSFILYQKMKYLYERNQIVILMMERSLNGESFDLKAIKNKKKSTYKDLVRMSTHQIKIYSTLVENSDTTTQSAQQSKDNDSQVLLLKSKRLYFISVCTIDQKKFAVTMGILDRIQSNLSLIRKQSSKNTTLNQEVNDLENLIKQQKSQIHANSFMEQLSSNEELKSQMSTLSISSATVAGKSKDLISGIDSYDTSFLEEKKLIEFPPPLEPVPVKPLFFDLAFNSVQFPSLEQRKKPVSKGLFGSFWGRS